MTSEYSSSGVPSSNEGSQQLYSALLEWMRSHGGNLHESVQIDQDERRGVHLRVRNEWRTEVPRNTHIIKTPLGVTMSYFNAIDHRLIPEGKSGSVHFPAHKVNFPAPFIKAVGPEETAIFFLVGQYMRGEEGFWFPYIRTLPQPGSLTTPLYYEGKDLEWLDGTSLLPAREQKLRLLKSKYESSFSELEKSEFADAAKYTWGLYLWASSIFVSRAFSAKVLSGVLPELGFPEENISVLLPFIDMLNHRPLAKVEWQAGKDSVDFLVMEEVCAGQEIANNYGPRNNEQLMMNYGFCIADNPCDYRTVNLRAPLGSPLQVAKAQQLQMFPDLAQAPEDHYYVFNIFYPLLAPDSPMEYSIFSPALFNAVSVLAANNRELETLEVSEHDIRIPNTYGNSRAAIASISQIVIELITHIVKLRASTPGSQPPGNLKQTHAKIYRDSQIMLSETALIIAAWTLLRVRQHGFHGTWEETKSLLGRHMAQVPEGKFSADVQSRTKVRILERPSLLTSNGELFALDDLFEAIPAEMRRPSQQCFNDIIVASEREIPPLRGISAAESPFRFPLFVCFVVAVYKNQKVFSSVDTALSSRLSRWASFLLEYYPPPPEDVAWTLEDEDDEQVLGMLDEVLEKMQNKAVSSLSNLGQFTGDWRTDAWWLSPNWVRWAWMVTESECVQVPENPLGLLAPGRSEGGQVMLSTETYLYIPQEQ